MTVQNQEPWTSGTFARTTPTADPLTTLADRRAFEQQSPAWIRARSSAFVLALIDLDDLQLVNQLYGHAVGDNALRMSARILAHSLRQDDLLARIGGDEFALLIGGFTLEEGRRHLDLVLEVIRAADVGKSLGRSGVGIAATCGMTEFSSGDTLASLLGRADDALSIAKRTRRGQVIARPALQGAPPL